jgi:ketosteroid isomerase-like protein
MPVITRIVSLCALIGLLPSTDLAAQGRASVEQTVRGLDEQARVAALKRDVAALERLWSDSLTVNAPNNQVVVGKRAVLEDFLKAGVINFSSFERHIEFVRVTDDFVFLLGAEIVTAKSDSPENGLVAGRTIHRRVTNIWRREGDTWRLYVRHANVIPQR